MSIFSRLLPTYKREDKSYQSDDKCHTSGDFFPHFPEDAESVDILTVDPRYGDGYLCGARVNIAVNILIRTIVRAGFVITRGGNDVTSGPEYAGGLPKELYVLNPRKLRHEGYGNGETHDGVTHGTRRWFYHAGSELIPMLSDELIHFRDRNPWGDVWYRPKNMIATSGSAAASGGGDTSGGEPAGTEG
jgi:hypothetical protein